MTEREKRKDRRFFFVHFAEPDPAGHKRGENSQEYADAITSDDEWTGTDGLYPPRVGNRIVVTR